MPLLFRNPLYTLINLVGIVRRTKCEQKELETFYQYAMLTYAWFDHLAFLTTTQVSFKHTITV